MIVSVVGGEHAREEMAAGWPPLALASWCRIDPRRLLSVLSRLFDHYCEAISSLSSPWLPRTQVEAHPHVKHKHTPSRLRCLRPVAYPCRAIHANHRLGPRVVD
jgi:hypothetical protein